MIHYVRPAGPIRRRRRFRESQRGLAAVVEHGERPVLTPAEVRQIRRRLRRLEGAIASELSESQHRWFAGHVTSGRHALALETLARGITNKLTHLPEPVREEIEWLAASLQMREAVASILEAQRVGVERATEGEGSGAEEHHGFDVPLDRFRSLVAAALDALPEEFRRAMTNVVITVEEESAARDAYGRYIGVPLTRRRHLQWNVHPDRIVIYRKTICEDSDSDEEVRARVYVTVIHEIAHHFGISDARLEELGWG
jgi:predicted Zn-dependent protease with MMP-like domain